MIYRPYIWKAEDSDFAENHVSDFYKIEADPNIKLVSQYREALLKNPENADFILEVFRATMKIGLMRRF